MASTAIVYKTIYGVTKKYAQWLSKELKCPVFEIDSVDLDSLKKFNTIIVMSGTYAAKMPLTAFLKNNWETLKSKKLVAVAVGAAPENNWWSKISYFFIPSFIKKKIKYFKIHGPYKGMGEQPKKENLNRVISYLKKK